jgi:hypothetical protein
VRPHSSHAAGGGQGLIWDWVGRFPEIPKHPSNPKIVVLVFSVQILSWEEVSIFFTTKMIFCPLQTNYQQQQSRCK